MRGARRDFQIWGPLRMRATPLRGRFAFFYLRKCVKSQNRSERTMLTTREVTMGK